MLVVPPSCVVHHTTGASAGQPSNDTHAVFCGTPMLVGKVYGVVVVAAFAPSGSQVVTVQPFCFSMREHAGSMPANVFVESFRSCSIITAIGCVGIAQVGCCGGSLPVASTMARKSSGNAQLN